MNEGHENFRRSNARLTTISSLAQAFTTVVTSFVSDILLPPLSVILPLNANLNFKFAVLQGGDNYEKWGEYNTIEQAQDDGAVIMACKQHSVPAIPCFHLLRLLQLVAQRSIHVVH